MVTNLTMTRRSYKLLTVDRTLLRVRGFSSSSTRKVNVSVFKYRYRPRLRYIGRVSVPRSWSFSSSAWLTGENVFRTSLLFEAILCSLRFEPASISWVHLN